MGSSKDTGNTLAKAITFYLLFLHRLEIRRKNVLFCQLLQQEISKCKLSIKMLESYQYSGSYLDLLSLQLHDTLSSVLTK